MPGRAKTPPPRLAEGDGAYFLKVVLYIILGSLWISFPQPIGIFNGFPIGFCLGLIFASHDHFAIDRKIEYALLVVMAVLSAFLKLSIMI